MTKSLSDRIALYADKNKSPAKQFLPAFIALKPDIEQALKDGWTIRQIWNILRQEDQGKSAGSDHEGFRFNSATEKEELV